MRSGAVWAVNAEHRAVADGEYIPATAGREINAEMDALPSGVEIGPIALRPDRRAVPLRDEPRIRPRQFREWQPELWRVRLRFHRRGNGPYRLIDEERSRDNRADHNELKDEWTTTVQDGANVMSHKRSI